MEVLIKTGAQILFGLAILFFVIWSIIAVYAMTTFGRSRSLSSTMALIYSLLAMVLVGWGLAILIQI